MLFARNQSVRDTSLTDAMQLHRRLHQRENDLRRVVSNRPTPQRRWSAIFWIREAPGVGSGAQPQAAKSSPCNRWKALAERSLAPSPRMMRRPCSIGRPAR